MTPCNHCGGSGKLAPHLTRRLRTCPTCSGGGWRPDRIFIGDTRPRVDGRCMPTNSERGGPRVEPVTLFDDPATYNEDVDA